MTDIIAQHRHSIPSHHQTHLLSPAFPLEPKKGIHPLLRFQHLLFHFRVLLSKVRDAPQNCIPSPGQTSAYIPLIK